MGQKTFEATIDLPSRGLLKGSVANLQIGSMTVREEKILFGKGEAGEKFQQIIADCSDQDVGAVRDFPFSDVIFAFIKIRTLSVGDPNYHFRVPCPNCQTPVEVNVNMDLQEVAYLTEENAKEPFEIVLPRSGSKILMRHKRLVNQIELDQMIRFRKQKGFRTDGRFVSENLSTMVEGIDGKTGKDLDFAFKIKFLDSLKIQDSNALHDAMDDRDFGISLRVPAECPECGNQDNFAIRMDPSFFRPGRGVR